MTPVFEHTTSPLTRSNDGRLRVARSGGPARLRNPWLVLDIKRPAGARALLRTYQREIADAYVAGYDEARRLAAESAGADPERVTAEHAREALEALRRTGRS